MERALRIKHEKSCKYWNEIIEIASEELKKAVEVYGKGSEEHKEASEVLSNVYSIALA